ncbi:MAG: ABC-ATPase domain-containing protein [Lentisphaerae bacterium]|nr:ABC-ATPase domain-containing protein [Lentisphaerota bacterium]
MPDDVNTLRALLRRLDGKGYPAYKDTRGAYRFETFELRIDHVQGDPFAAPSRLRVRVPMRAAAFPESTRTPAIRCTALRDYLARAFSAACDDARETLGSGKSGMLAMDRPGQEILARSSIAVSDAAVEARFVAGLPARGRRILGRQAERLLCDTLPPLVERALLYRNLQTDRLTAHLDTAEDAEALRGALAARRLVAFVADGAVLPRRSGIDDRPLEGRDVVPFQSPPSLRQEIELPHAGTVAGMGVPAGVTLIVGGGYHGKSTLLQALERGVYNHVPADGRERVAADPTAVKIRAEDGRPVEGVDIRPFINNLPGGGTPEAFRTANASGSTSQAANIMEALEAGARLLLLDEDTCATNLMIRDARMQALVEKNGEPITPFLDRVRTLADEAGVGTILVLGGSGDYFDVADTVIRMDTFVPRDVTREARAIAAAHPSGRRTEADLAWPDALVTRYPDPASLDPRKGRREVSIKARALRAVQYGTNEIDLAHVAQLVDEGQVRAIGKAMELARRRFMRPGTSMAEVVAAVMQAVADGGLDVLDDRPVGDYAAFRAYEFAAAVNRLRSLRCRHLPSGAPS